MTSVLLTVLGTVAFVVILVTVLYRRGCRLATGFILELLSVESVASGRFIGYQTCMAFASTAPHHAELFVYGHLYRMWRNGLVSGSVRELKPESSLDVKDMDWKLTERGQRRLEHHLARGRR